MSYNKLKKAKPPVRVQRHRSAPFGWLGAKNRVHSKLMARYPNHRRFVDVFGGSGTCIFNKPRSRIEIYNDRNSALYNFYFTLRDDKLRSKLVWLAEHTPASQEQYAACIKTVQASDADAVERAWAFFFSAQFSYAGRDPTMATVGNYFVNLDNGLPRRWLNVRQHLERLSLRFRSVIVEGKPWQEIVAKYDGGDTFFYMDPPYLPETRATGGDYACEMSRADHLELLTCIKSLKGKVMISGYPSTLYEQQLAEWRKREFEVTCTVSPSRSKRTETIWMNYNAAGIRLAV